MGWLIRLIFLGICGWLLWQLFSEKVPPLPTAAGVCPQPLFWRLGELDPAFGLSREQALAQIEQAAAMWNHAIGKPILQQDPDHGFLIDFRFDERQHALLQQHLLQRNLARYDGAITPGMTRLAEQFTALEQQISDFNQHKAKLDADIQHHQPHSPQSDPQRQQLQRRQQQLQQEADWLEQQRQTLLRDQDYLNETIRQRNTLLQQHTPSQGGSFEVGLFEVRGGQRKMTIFAFNSTQDLTSTLVHEFGHAFGLPHTAEPDSIMHHSLNASQQQLTAADLAAFHQVCRD